MYALENMKTFFLLLNIYLLSVVIFAFLACFKDKSAFAMRYYLKFQKALFWNTPIRLVLEGYIELSLTVFISTTDMVWEAADYSVMLDNVFAILLMVLVLGLPLFIFSFYTCHMNDMLDEDFIESFGGLYGGMKLDKPR